MNILKSLRVVPFATGFFLVSVPSIVSAESSVYKPQKTKLPIYDEPEKPKLIYEDPNTLEIIIRNARHSVTNAFAGTKDKIQKVTDEWIGYENKLKSVLAGYAGKEDKLLPGAIYVTIGFFAGSILARNRSIIGRTIFPLTLATGSFIYFYPTMSKNILTSVILNQQNDKLSNLDVSFTKTFDSIWHAIQEQFGFGKEDPKKNIKKIESMYTTRVMPIVNNEAVDLKMKVVGSNDSKASESTVIHEKGRPKS